MSIFRAALVSLCCLLFAGPVLAQDQGRTILVLDGSGSMWGQIDGIAKITIAQQVVGELLTTLPDSQSLGLTVYGHRERGNCADIETLVLPGQGSRADIAAAVNGVQPKGKTPMTDAVIAAAQALRFTEEKATVILVSDGIETCNPDPCAAAAALEAAGIDFTAHVIGFDITDPVLWELKDAEGRVATLGPANPAQIALFDGSYEITATWTVQGVSQTRQFVVAAMPRDLRVVFEVPKPKATITAPQTAVLGSEIELAWTGPDGEGDYISVGLPGGKGGYVNYAKTEEGSPLKLQMPPAEGAYELRYQTAKSEILVAVPITITPTPVTITAPATASVGQEIELAWTGPDYDRDYISVAKPGGKGGYVNYTYTSEGSPLILQMPPEPGPYEIRYQLAQDGEILASVPISIQPVQVSITAPASATLGSRIEIAWTGPNYDRDYVSIGKPGGKGGYVNCTYTSEGSPLILQMPPEPGPFEIRYQLAQDGQILASVPIAIEAVQVGLTAPATAIDGSSIEVGWQGPGNPRDYVSIAVAGDNGYSGYACTETGNPIRLRIPSAPGSYELRYVLDQDGMVLASVPITVTEATATLTLPATMSKTAGQVEVAWQGPGNDGDFLSIGPVGEDAYTNWVYTDANPRVITLPEAPGTYELRHHLAEGERIIARQTFTVTE